MCARLRACVTTTPFTIIKPSTVQICSGTPYTRAPEIGLTYLLTPWSRVLLEKLTGFAASQEIPRILWNPKLHYRTYKRPPTVPILSQLHPVPTTPSHFLKIHLNIILPSTSWFPQWSLSLRFPPPKRCAHLSLSSYAPHAPPISFFSILSPVI